MKLVAEILVLIGGCYTLLRVHLEGNRGDSEAENVRINCEGGAVAVGGDVTVNNTTIQLEETTIVLAPGVYIHDSRSGELIAALPAFADRPEASR